MYCTKCGATNAPGTQFCTTCGAPLATETAQATVVTTAPKSGFDMGKMFTQLKDTVADFFNGVIKPLFAKKAVLYGTIGGAAALIVAIVLCIVLVPSETAPIDNLIAVTFKGETEKIEQLAPEAYWEYMEDEYDTDLDDVIEQYEDSSEMVMEMLEEEYGDNIRVSYKVTNKKELSEKKLNNIADGLKENYEIKKKSVTKGYKLDLELTIKGSDDEDTNDAEIIVVQIDGKWYAVSESGRFLFGM